MTTPALDLRNLQFAYPSDPGSGPIDVLQGIDLHVEPGARLGLVGPNGAGKTTLFLTICGVLTPTQGSVHLFGKPIQPGQFHPDVGLVFQYPSDQLFSPSVRDDVAFGPLNMGLPADEVNERVDRVLANTGLAELSERAPHHLSGGQKRMVAIAGVQAMEPRLIIYDEPSANLDIRSRRRLIQFMQESTETLIVASHDLELVLEVCTEVILLDEGRIIASGPTQAIMSDSALMEAHGLERPHSLAFHSGGHHP